MVTVTVEEVQAQLPDLIAKMKPGEEVLIVEQDPPVARLVAEPAPARGKRQAGSAIGILRIVADDDAHLEDFREYMP